MPDPQPALPPAGWHPDPTGTGQLRYWDGAAWTGSLRPEQTPHPAPPLFSGFDQPNGPSDPAPAAAPARTDPGESTRPGLPHEAGFFRSLFDLSFAADRQVTVKFARVLYTLAIAGSVAAWLLVALLIFVIGAYEGDSIFAVWGVLHLLVGWVIPLLTVAGVRVLLEVMIAQIRTSQYTAQLVQHSARPDAARARASN